MSDLISILAGTLRVATPLILCAMGGLFSERSGVIDVGLEGKMLAAAFASATVAAFTGSAWAGLSAGILIACLMALLHGLACITYRGNQVVSGVAINILASGLTMVFAVAWFHMGGQTPGLDSAVRFMPLTYRNKRVLGLATAYLIRSQGADGGFPQQYGGESNAQSTAWAVQGLIAVHEGESINADALTAMLRQIIADNRAGGWRKLKDPVTGRRNAGTG